MDPTGHFAWRLRPRYHALCPTYLLPYKISRKMPQDPNILNIWLRVESELLESHPLLCL